MALDQDLEPIVKRYVSQIAAEIAALVRARVMGELEGTAVVPRAPALPAARGTKKAAAVKGQKRHTPDHCLAPACKRPHGGPRSGWFCETHLESIGALERKQLQMKWKIENGARR